jgi:hypothetical protein
MNTEQHWKLFGPVILEFIKNKKKEYEADGLIPTLELLVEDLETSLT